MKREIIITGFGGQGILLMGRILGKAATLGDHLESTLVQSYGPESRGGSCSAQVIISDLPIHYPYVRDPDTLVCMSQGGFEKQIGLLGQKGNLIIDQDLVHGGGSPGPHLFSIPATRMAEEMGRKMMANIIMLGFLTVVAGVVSVTAASDGVTSEVPKGTEAQNLSAFEKGCDYARAQLKGRLKRAAGRGEVGG